MTADPRLGLRRLYPAATAGGPTFRGGSGIRADTPIKPFS
ncbi:hypothetical protein M878_01390 [Streptomyces roseochromogenus subsp. oscitans DS 12.976]|uniref:Uncharacterized protein n=1 Tax=Streptomyces roseochromogenus subsp. oscitans DS 12.976 TaxID=1352936 RepID=V6KX12_STRRC|nr:hypothetical protein M878_01390 [Streptomyces roseochromogenus subsp. oscitans DS 12.976]